MNNAATLRLGIVQFAPRFGDRDYNLQTIQELIEGSPVDLVVLPELCTTGYQFTSHEELRELAEPVPDGPTVRLLTGIARDRQCWCVCGLAERAGKRCYNSAVLVGPEGYIGRYRKAHLFQDEKRWFTPGNTPFRVYEAAGCRIGMLICFDWLFPEAWRILALEGADIVCHPSNLVLPGMAQHGTVTRAMENRFFVATANRTGIEHRAEPRLAFTGRSQVVAPGGRLLAACGPREKRMRVVPVDPGQARNKRITPHNDVMADRRIRLYERLVQPR